MAILTEEKIRRAIWESMYQSTPWEHFHIHISEEDKAIAEAAYRETLKMVEHISKKYPTKGVEQIVGLIRCNLNQSGKE